MRGAILALLCLPGITTVAIAQASPRPPTPQLPLQGGAEPGVLGTREFVRILGKDPITVTAELKPGAGHATLKVASFKYVPLGDGLAVHFVVTRGAIVTSGQVSLQRPVLEDLHVPLRNGGIRHVPLVALDICVGDTPMKVDFRLHRRDDYGPAMTLAAPQLKQLGVRVDTRRSFTWPPDCTVPATGASAASPAAAPAD